MYNVLIVDDDDLVLGVLEQIVRRLGHHVGGATNGYQALLMFENRGYDVVITDIYMPGIDGYSLALHIRGCGRPYTPIIGISGTPWLLDDKFFDHVIAKPFNIQALASAIDSVMTKRPDRQKTFDGNDIDGKESPWRISEPMEGWFYV